LIIKETSKSIIIKSIITGVVPLVLLFSGLVQNQSFVVPVFAEPPDPCFGDDCEGSTCSNKYGESVLCCWLGPNGENVICQRCEIDLPSGDFVNCTTPASKGQRDSNVIAPPPSGVAPPPSTQTCPENTALDASGNCAPATQGSTDQQGTTEPPTKTPPTTDQNEKPQVKEKNKDTNSEK
jgi:hypothetical protein